MVNLSNIIDKKLNNKQMKNYLYIGISLVLFSIVYGCSKHETDFRDFLGEKELTYTGAVGDVISQPGNLRVQLKWKASTDPSITKYIVYWNNKADSQVVDINERTDSVKTVISGLKEFVYTFTIHSFDAKGNKSIAKEVNNVKVYGPVYNSTLLNRAYNASTPYVVNNNGSITLNFTTPDTIHVETIINYTNAAGVASTASLLGTDSTVLLPSYQPGTKVMYRSSYKPEQQSIDIFTVAQADEYPSIFQFIQLDKSMFKEIRLPNDVNTYESGTSISKLWDGSVGPQGYPNIFHSDGNHLPHVLTFDMGKVYDNLAQMEEVGRDCCNNPSKFEVWGIADITNAATTLRGDNPGWKAEAIAKGWTLLREVNRSDNGVNALKVDLISNPPPVRYIRIRVINTTTGSAYSNMSELTFWNKQ